MKKSNNYCAESNVTADRSYNTALNNTLSTVRDQSMKADGGKIRMELIPTSAIYSIGRVLTHGADKYGPNTWQSVEYERYVGALIRHLLAFIDDPLGKDADSGMPHTEHLLANAVFLNDAVVRGRIQLNERP